MQFKVPQFLEIEDKIFGPFTFKEFVYLAGGAGLCFIIYKLVGLLFGLVPMVAVAAFSMALTFYKPNNKPFLNMVEVGLKYFANDKLYIWKRREYKVNKPSEREISQEAAKQRARLEASARLGANKLRDLAWSLDVLDLSKHQSNS